MNSVTQFIDYKKQVRWLIAVATCVRIFLATQLELGNDEVYYWTYSLFPDWSHFDHPLMVGILGQVFSANLFFKDDFFLRLGPIVLSALSTWMIFLVGKKIKDERTGFFAAFLFTGSVYGSILSGFSFIPDAPLVFFWMLGMNLMIDFLPTEKITSSEQKKILWFGLVAGLAMASKYQGAFLWIAVFIYVFLYNRKWLKEITFYGAGIISFIALLPVLIWNFQNQFISFTFHSERITPAWQFRLDYFLTEIFGQMVYNNPVVYVLIFISVIAVLKGKKILKPQTSRVLFALSLPLWLVFTSFSIFRSTLPHWTAPAFLSLIVLAAAYWSESNSTKIFFWIKFPAYFLVLLLSLALWLINYSPLQLGKIATVATFGEDDFTQDLFGWHQVNRAFVEISKREESNRLIPKNTSLISTQWFPGAHLDFYVAQPNHRKLFLIGSMNDLHKYAWINAQRGGLEKGKDYYHIALSNLYKDPNEMFKKYFEKIEPMDTVQISRSGKPMRYAFFYRLKNYRGNFINPLPNR